MLPTPRSVAICLVVVCFASVALGILLKTKSGISKVYFGEVPKGIQERFHYDAASQSQSRSDQVFLTERLPVRTHSGSVGLPPGTELRVNSKTGDTSHV